MNRRELLKLTSLTVAGATTNAALGVSLASPAAAATSGDWLGHKAGRIYLGISTGPDLSSALRTTGPVGLRRTYYGWANGAGETSNIAEDHAARRLPWISFKPPSTAPGGWSALASGRYDTELRLRARRYAQSSGPVIVTFNHEPHNDATGTPDEFARAWCRVHDVMNQETSLQNVISVPIIGEWCFNPYNHSDNPGAFISPAVLDRCAFLGVDLYQNRSGQGYAERLGRVLAWLNGQGHSEKMVGLGETGATNSYGSPTGAEWWSRSWQWAVANVNRVGAISYFNSLHNNNSGNNWTLTESADKAAAFRASLASATACTL